MINITPFFAETMLPPFVDSLLHSKLVFTLLILLGILVLKFLLVKLVRKWAKKKDEDRRDLINNIKNFLNFAFIAALLAIWATELQEFALSIAAFAVAIVIATREFIQCVIGFFYLISTRPFRIGDWIQVGEYVGEVAETDWVKSTLLEVDIRNYQYTGKTLFIPNNKLITSPIKNLNFLRRYATHHFKITRDESVNPYVFMDQLLDNAKNYCEDFFDVATRYNQMIEHRLGIRIAGPEPHISVMTTELGDTVIEITIFCPTELALEIEQRLTVDFMALWFEEKHKCKSN